MKILENSKKFLFLLVRLKRHDSVSDQFRAHSFQRVDAFRVADDVQKVCALEVNFPTLFIAAMPQK